MLILTKCSNLNLSKFILSHTHTFVPVLLQFVINSRTLGYFFIDYKNDQQWKHVQLHKQKQTNIEAKKSNYMAA